MRTAPGVLRATGLPEAWYPADDENESVGITPSLFFAPTPSPLMTMMVDPSMIMRAGLEGSLTLAVDGGTELRAESDVPLVAEDRTIEARLTDVKLVMRDTFVGETATVDI
ncbi:DUF6004 family protein [Streptomyces sp. NPDC012637]|uniref:DUF6004 family protein n=1 Tax=Streptomyces sp. NPDC012637 TaxID=3364842 RepID=UPI0036E03AA3